MKKRTFTDQEKNEIVNLFLSGKTITDIYNEHGISAIFTKKILLERGYELPTKFKYKLNHKIFNIIDNNDKAYWLGFLFADGHVRKRNNICEIKLKISIKDSEHLEKFRKFIGSTHPIVTSVSKVKYKNTISTSECVSLSVYSKEMFNDLNKLGCVVNKTKRIGQPKIEKKYFNHFIRGYFDGDGCISNNKNNKYKILSFTSASSKILLWINEVFSSNEISSRDLNNLKKYYRLRYFRINDLKKIYDFIYYESNVFLERKKNKFQ